MFFCRSIVRCRKRPYCQCTLHQHLISCFQFCKSPMFLLSDPVIHVKVAVNEAVFHISLFNKWTIAVFGVISSQSQVCHAVEPSFVNFFIVFTKFFYPYRGKMLWHDVFDRIDSIITLFIDILNFHGPVVFKTFQNIYLIFTVHLINRTNRKCFNKFSIIREPATIRLRIKCILEFFKIAVIRTIVSNDFSMEHQENLIQSIGRKIANRSTEQVILGVKENFFYISKG